MQIIEFENADFYQDVADMTSCSLIKHIIIIIYLYSLKTWHEYYNQCYTKNLHTMMSF